MRSQFSHERLGEKRGFDLDKYLFIVPKDHSLAAHDGKTYAVSIMINDDIIETKDGFFIKDGDYAHNAIEVNSPGLGMKKGD